MKYFYPILFCIISNLSIAQNAPEVAKQNISTDANVEFRIFATKNMYTFIKLNTTNGKMTQIQWGTETKNRFETVLSNTSLVSPEGEIPGRFFLYPTSNLYNFILLDQIDGRAWQVQWGKENERMVLRIH